MTKIFNLSNITLLVALSLSTVAAYYSIIGLTAIFAGAAIPIIIMGSILEIGKITTTVWLRKYWKQCSVYLKLYLVPAVVLLAILTSMGIFGFLSKAHMDTGLVSGDIQAKLVIFDEKIKTERENIETARKALSQMDSQVEARLSRGDNEQSAERAVQIRRQQQPERQRLIKEIGEAQAKISILNEQRAPLAAENRKVEAEVGPIKYVAALLYGDNPNSNLLERAVRWVIILLVVVFDPLAIALVLAANASREWDKKKQDDVNAMNISADPPNVVIRDFSQKELSALDDPLPLNSNLKEDAIVEPKNNETEINQKTHPYLYQPVTWLKNFKPVVYVDDSKVSNTEITSVVETANNLETPVEILAENNVSVLERAEDTNTLQDLGGGYILYDGKSISKDALKEIKPEFFIPNPDENEFSTTKFGKQFPRLANKGDIFVRVDILPNKVFKFDGRRWFEVNKETIDSYLDDDYIKFLVSKLESGEYDIEYMLDKERDYIELYLQSQKNQSI